MALNEAAVDRLSEETTEKYRRYVNPGIANILNFGGFQVPEERAAGCYIWDASGRKFLDCVGGYGAFSLGHLNEVIGSLIATRVLIQYLPQTIGFFLLRFRSPEMPRPFRMWLYPFPGIVSLCGWVYVLATAAARSLWFAFVVLGVGPAEYMARARVQHEWPFAEG